MEETSGGPVRFVIGVQADPSVGVNRLSGDITGVFARQENEDSGNFFGRGGASQGDVALHFFSFDWIVGPGGVERRESRAGRDGIHPNSAVSVLERQGTSEIPQAAFAGRVGDETGLGDQLMIRRIVDDYAGALLQK